MARKKKSSKVTNSNSVGYKGVVTVSVAKGKRIISTNTYHNTGTIHLFEFFCQALCGQSASADNTRPRFIHLYHFGPKGGNLPTEAEVAPLLISENKCTTSNIMYNDTAFSVWKSTDSSNPYSTSSGEVSFKFVIPFTQIQKRKTGEINGFCLYSTKNRTTYASPSAYFVLTDGNGKLGDLGITDNSEYNLIIQWKMVIQNK